MIAWTGDVLISDIGYVLGGAALAATLTSECVNGEQYRVSVNAAFGGLNIGFLPGGTSYSSNETLEDNLNYIDPNIFEGSAGLGSVGVVLGGGYSITHIRLGGASTPGYKPNVGSNAGLAEGALAMLGKSWLTGPPQKISCGCGQ